MISREGRVDMMEVEAEGTEEAGRVEVARGAEPMVLMTGMGRLEAGKYMRNMEPSTATKSKERGYCVKDPVKFIMSTSQIQ